MTLDPAELRDAEAAVREANLAFARRYPGESDAPQPVHTFIEGAQHFSADISARRGEQALRALGDYAPDAATLGKALGIANHPSLTTIDARVRTKLAREPIEDYRIDFEDGFGVRSEAEEDSHVAIVAAELSRGLKAATLPPAIGVRIKPLTEELRQRSIRTLDLLLTAMVSADGLPPGWTVTVPKVTVLAQVEYIVAVLRSLERSLQLPDGMLRFSMMVEVPQVILDASGKSLLPHLLDASDGRLAGIDFGTYDYTAACGITASEQRLRHPACDFAKDMLQVALAGTGIPIADGSTALLPIPTHPAERSVLSDRQHAENVESVHAGWAVHFGDVRSSLAGGIYRGWDLHPAQLVSRYAAVASFYLEGIDVAGARLKSLLNKAENATIVGGMLDEPATGQGLLGFFLRAIATGAITEAVATEITGLSSAELHERSFVKIMRRRGVAAADPSLTR
jgi:citrate lyase beta subunit